MLILATRNAHKIAEIRGILRELPLQVVGLAEMGVEGPELKEEENTYAGNAREKARAVARWFRCWALADDSGLEVEALGGAPGIRSHRFAGPEATDEQNIALLLARLRGVPPAARRARFRAAAALASPHGEVWVAEGTWEGFISREPRGREGFGYDPVFVPSLPRAGKTVAEIEPESKAVFGHRGKAVRGLWPLLGNLATRKCV